MIEIFKEKLIVDEKEREAALVVIAEREAYYVTLFANAQHPPRITVRFEGARPLTIRITFVPVNGRTIIIDTQSYSAPDVAVKHAFKKLRRVAKNYFVKNKKRHRELF